MLVMGGHLGSGLHVSSSDTQHGHGHITHTLAVGNIMGWVVKYFLFYEYLVSILVVQVEAKVRQPCGR